MAITAHPDDEAANFGGTLRVYHDRGAETCVVCLTPGQAASHRGGARNDLDLAAIRRKEFADSCEVLGVTRGIVLDYPDGQLHRQDAYRVVCDLTQQIRDFRPHVVLTFGPEGGVTGHTDHSMVSVFASLAFHWAGRENRFPDQLTPGPALHRPQKLYYATSTVTLTDRPPVAPPPITTTIEIGAHAETKIAAFRKHLTQIPLHSPQEKHTRKETGQELFHLAASLKLTSSTRETDLFEGVTADD